MGIGNASACLNNEWALFNNVGSLAQLDRTKLSISQYAIPSFLSFSRTAAVFAMPVRIGVAGVGVYRFGDMLFSEQLATIGFSNKLGLASLGVSASYIQHKAEGFGSRSSLALAFGGLAEITEKFSIGAHIQNLNQPKLSQGVERIPARFTLGTAIEMSAKVFVAAELEKSLDQTPILKAGIRYELNKKVKASTGVNINPKSAFAGLSLSLRRFNVDYAIQLHEYFGIAHHATIGFTAFKR